MIVVTGATGKTGRLIAEALLRANKAVRVVARHRDRLDPLIAQGAEPAVGDLANVDFLEQTCRGAGAVYAMIPPDPQADDLRAHYAKIGEALVNACARAHVSQVVNLSSLGAHLPSGTGPVVGLYDQEQRFNRLAEVNILHLRPGYFMENLLEQIPLIRAQTLVASAIRGDVAFPVVAVRDVANAAVKALLGAVSPGHRVQELRGPADLTYQYMTETIGRIINKPDIRYVQWSYPEMEQSLRQSGASESVARALVELARAVNQGVGITVEGRTSDNTTETRFEVFAEQLAIAYDALRSPKT